MGQVGLAGQPQVCGDPAQGKLALVCVPACLQLAYWWIPAFGACVL